MANCGVLIVCSVHPGTVRHHLCSFLDAWPCGTPHKWRSRDTARDRRGDRASDLEILWTGARHPGWEEDWPRFLRKTKILADLAGET